MSSAAASSQLDGVAVLNEIYTNAQKLSEKQPNLSMGMKSYLDQVKSLDFAIQSLYGRRMEVFDYLNHSRTFIPTPPTPPAGLPTTQKSPYQNASPKPTKPSASASEAFPQHPLWYMGLKHQTQVSGQEPPPPPPPQYKLARQSTGGKAAAAENRDSNITTGQGINWAREPPPQQQQHPDFASASFGFCPAAASRTDVF